jgi:hypothetical protein
MVLEDPKPDEAGLAPNMPTVALLLDPKADEPPKPPEALLLEAPNGEALVVVEAPKIPELAGLAPNAFEDPAPNVDVVLLLLLFDPNRPPDGDEVPKPVLLPAVLDAPKAEPLLLPKPPKPLVVVELRNMGAIVR